jgi:hypothetical protein
MRRFLLTALAAGLLVLVASPARAEDDPTPAAVEQASEARRAATARAQQMVDELMPITARMRGLTWKRPVPVRVFSREELQAYIAEEIKKEVPPEELQRDERILRRLGLVREGQDILELQLLMLREMVAGLYNPDTGEMLVVEGPEGDGQKPTILHELIHALEDQHYDIKAMEKPYRDHDPDRHFAIRCLLEGSAEWARRAYQDAYPDVARTYYAQLRGNEDAAAGQMRVMTTVPAYLMVSSLLHYRAGPNFVTHAVGTDYPGGMQRLLDDPPTTQEHMLHPYKWLGPRRDYPRTVRWCPKLLEAAGEGWRLLDEQTVGELDFAVFIDFFLGDEDGRLNVDTLGAGQFVASMANRAARGWDAGHARYLEGPDEHITVVTAYAFDTARDAAEAADIMGAALRGANGAAWKGLGWQSAGPDGARSFDYEGLYGRGRILQRGEEVLLLDGARGNLDALWAAVTRTTFDVDARDVGGEGDAIDPFEGCSVVDHRRGLGLVLPPGWSAKEGSGPYRFAQATNGSLEVHFLVLDQEVSFAGLAELGAGVLGPGFREKNASSATVMGGPGLSHPMPRDTGMLYLGSDAARSYVVLVKGSSAARGAAAIDIQALLDGVPMPRPTRRGALPVARPPAGIRSVPGY